MYEVFKIKSSKTNPKFQQYLTNFEKPQIFSKKSQNLGFKSMNTWNAREYKLTTWRKAWWSLKKPCITDLRERSECLGEKTTISQERYRENDRQIAQGA